MESKTNKKVTTYCTKRNIIRKRIERLSVLNALRATAGKECWHFICEYRLTVKDRIMGAKLLQSGKVVDLKIFVPLLDADYPYYEELSIDAAACDAEVESYLFEEKWGVRQERLDFDTDEPEEAVIIEDKPKKRGRKKQIEAPAPLDATA